MSDDRGPHLGAAREVGANWWPRFDNFCAVLDNDDASVGEQTAALDDAADTASVGRRVTRASVIDRQLVRILGSRSTSAPDPTTVPVTATAVRVASRVATRRRARPGAENPPTRRCDGAHLSRALDKKKERKRGKDNFNTMGWDTDLERQ